MKETHTSLPKPDPTMTHRVQNRLGLEKSPYLLQHQHNPVDWFPWGEEAFARARALDRPIFLSVGYSTCHWCHVMERESFEDELLASRLNQVFVPIKVDREERPDVDDLYMTVCHLLTGSGGWPLTVLLTPNLEPFFAGTYFPKESQLGRIGLGELVDRVEALWRDRREDAIQSAERLRTALIEESSPASGEALGEDVLDAARAQLGLRFDPRSAGFGTAPKFPTPHNLIFLLRQGHRTGDAEAIRMARATLDAMRRGGIFDQVGLGFHRYSTDSKWLVPHFEKMLYDQALLAFAYLEAAALTHEPSYGRTAEEIFTYVLRDLRGAHGAFLCAEDADSEGEEGRFYVFTAADLREALPDSLFPLAQDAWGVTEAGNFSGEASGRPSAANILHLPHPQEALASRHGLSSETLASRLEEARAILLATRERRVRPSRDDKVLTDLNGLMIAALARGAQVLSRPDLARVAREAADFLWSTLRRPRVEGTRLWHRYRDGEAGIAGYLDDYAFTIWGLLELHGATLDPVLLGRAQALQATLDHHHWDAEAGGYFLAADDAEALILRRKTVYDGAIPSGNSVSAQNLLRLGRLTGDARYEAHAAALLRAFAGQVRAAPMGHCFLLLGLAQATDASQDRVSPG